MSQPTPYTPATNFNEEETDQVGGRSGVRTAALDAELDAIETTLDGLCANLALIQRDDGELKDRIVKIHTLATDVVTLMGSGAFTINDPVAWATGQNYAARSIVTNGTGTYVAVSTHVSAALFSTDLAAGKWVLLFDSTALDAANVVFTPTGDLVSVNVQAAIAELDSEALKIGEVPLSRNLINGGDFSMNPWSKYVFNSAGIQILNGHTAADGFAYRASGSAAAFYILRQIDAPTVAQAGRLTQHNMCFDCFTADAAPAAAAYAVVEYDITGRNAIAIARKNFVLSFWHKHTNQGTHAVSFRTSDGFSYVATYQQDTGSQWEYAEIPVPAKAAWPSVGTIDEVQVRVAFVLFAGSNYQTPAGAWTAGDYLVPTGGAENAADSTANFFRLALIQLEAGTEASGFFDESYEQTLLNLRFLKGRNLVMGGDFATNPWQRGSTFAAVADNTYTADGWVYRKSGAMVHTVQKTADAPSTKQAGVRTTSCLHVDCTTVDAAIAAGDFCYVVHHIEGYDFAPYHDQVITLSFWHKHTKVGLYSVALRNSVPDNSWLGTYTQAVADTWEFTEITIYPDRFTTLGTWDFTTGIGASLIFTIAAGANFQRPVVAPFDWAGNPNVQFADDNQVNACDNVANDFKLALVQLEPGPRATPFEALHPGDVLALCQRYYQKSFPLATAPAQNAGLEGATGTVKEVAAGADCGSAVCFPVRMRAVPTVTFYNPSALNANWRNTSLALDSGVASAQFAGTNGFLARNSSVAGDGAGDMCAINWTAEASL